MAHTVRDVEAAIDAGDVAAFKRAMEDVSVLPFRVESKAIMSRKKGFIVHLIEKGKLSNGARVLLGSAMDSRVEKMMKAKNL